MPAHFDFCFLAAFFGFLEPFDAFAFDLVAFPLAFDLDFDLEALPLDVDFLAAAFLAMSASFFSASMASFAFLAASYAAVPCPYAP